MVDPLSRVRAVVASGAARRLVDDRAAAASPAEAAAVAGLTAEAVRAAPDPYWPKWDGPWWTLLLVHELGHAVPRPAVQALVDLARRTWLPIFPRTQAELDVALATSPGCLVFDGARHVACFCALGGLAALAHAADVDLDAALPWWRRWLVEYQLADGGWNCDEAAHIRAAPCSSIVSTAPILEALLARHATLVPAERDALDRGARYLLARRLVRSLRKDAVVDARWLAPAFPRFYGYDALRGLALVARWARVTGAVLPADAVADVVEALSSRVGPAGLLAGTNDLVDQATTVRPQAGSGPWTGRQTAARPPLLADASRPGPCAALERAWAAALADLAALDRAGALG